MSKTNFTIDVAVMNPQPKNVKLIWALCKLKYDLQ